MKETGFVDGSHLTRPTQPINDGILSDVFGVTSAVCRTPDNDVPFVLPHAARKN
jgi:ABC-type hemin transport system ATPase subunit